MNSLAIIGLFILLIKEAYVFMEKKTIFEVPKQKINIVSDKYFENIASGQNNARNTIRVLFFLASFTMMLINPIGEQKGVLDVGVSEILFLITGVLSIFCFCSKEEYINFNKGLFIIGNVLLVVIFFINIVSAELASLTLNIPIDRKIAFKEALQGIFKEPYLIPLGAYSFTVLAFNMLHFIGLYLAKKYQVYAQMKLQNHKSNTFTECLKLPLLIITLTTATILFIKLILN